MVTVRSSFELFHISPCSFAITTIAHHACSSRYDNDALHIHMGICPKCDLWHGKQLKLSPAMQILLLECYSCATVSIGEKPQFCSLQSLRTSHAVSKRALYLRIQATNNALVAWMLYYIAVAVGLMFTFSMPVVDVTMRMEWAYSDGMQRFGSCTTGSTADGHQCKIEIVVY